MIQGQLIAPANAHGTCRPEIKTALAFLLPIQAGIVPLVIYRLLSFHVEKEGAHDVKVRLEEGSIV